MAIEQALYFIKGACQIVPEKKIPWEHLSQFMIGVRSYSLLSRVLSTYNGNELSRQLIYTMRLTIASLPHTLVPT